MFLKNVLATNVLLLMVALSFTKPTPDDDSITVDEDDDYLAYAEDESNTQVEARIPSQDCRGPGKIGIHVACQLSSIEIRVDQEGSEKTLLYVDGHKDDTNCRKEFPSVTNSFHVKFNTCGVVFKDNKATYNLMILRDNKIDNGDSRLQEITCHYPSKNEHASKPILVIRKPASRHSTNTTMHLPPPTHKMYITTINGTTVERTEPGDKLIAVIAVQPKIYQAYATDCTASAQDTAEVYPVTDHEGCAVNSNLFGQWRWSKNSHSLQANFIAFKFIDTNKMRLDCVVHYCYDKCPPRPCPSSDSPCLQSGKE